MACQLFAQHGFEGTHIRDVCDLAGVNVAAIFYYFRDKQGLYDAVRAAAREQLASRAASNAVVCGGLAPTERLQAIIKSLLVRLSVDSGWIARLVMREISDGTEPPNGTVGEGFQADLALLESAIHDAVGSNIDANSVRLEALNVVSQCVFFCAAGKALTQLSPSLPGQALKADQLARHITLVSLRGLTVEPVHKEGYDGAA